MADIPSLAAIYLERCSFDSADAFAFREQRPNISIRVVGRGFLGVMGPLDDSERSCTISQVVAGTAASEAGLRVDDRIIAIDGVAVKSFQDLIFIVGSKQPGDVIELELERGGEMQTVSAKLKSRDGFDE
jgi:S1-C subfamily serine protease